MQVCLRTTLTLLLLTLLPLHSSGSTKQEEAPWKMATMLLHEDSITALEAADRVQPERDNQLAIAIQTLNLQPKTDGNTERARQTFEDLSKGEDETALIAHFYLARIAQYHSGKPDQAQALASYDSLYAKAPKSFWGQLAYLKATSLRLYSEDPTAAKASLAEALKNLQAIDQPVVRRNLLYTLAEFIQLSKGDERQALALYLEAHKIGFSRAQTTESLLLRIGELGKRLGEHEVAVRAWQQFIEEFPRHSHTHMIRQRLAAAKGQP